LGGGRGGGGWSPCCRAALATSLLLPRQQVAGRLTHDQADKSVIPLILNFLMNKEEAPEVRAGLESAQRRILL
jgi:hypothetical protein